MPERGSAGGCGGVGLIGHATAESRIEKKKNSESGKVRVLPNRRLAAFGRAGCYIGMGEFGYVEAEWRSMAIFRVGRQIMKEF